jgi:hypothetical protein
MEWQQQDNHRAVLDSIFRAPAYRWVEAKDPFAILRRWWVEFKEWLNALQDASPIGYQLFVYALLLILAVALIHTLWVLYHTVGSAARTSEQGTKAERAPRTVAWYQSEASQLAREGRYPEAIQADFLALVLELDARKLLRFHPSKTPAEYANESQLPAGASAEFRELVRGVYGYAFARWPCDAESYARWRADADPERYAAAH